MILCLFLPCHLYFKFAKFEFNLNLTGDILLQLYRGMKSSHDFTAIFQSVVIKIKIISKTKDSNLRRLLFIQFDIPIYSLLIDKEIVETNSS